jgi:hypothetical protein
VAATDYTAIAGTGTKSPLHRIVQFHHPVAVDADETIRPDGAGNNTEWTAEPVGNNYTRLNAVPYSEATYVYTSTSADTEKDSYTFGNTSLTVVDKLTFNIRALRRLAGPYDITIFARQAGGSEKDVGTITVPQATGSTDLWEDFTLEAKNDPHTSIAWTAANVNAYEFGFYPDFDTVAATETLAPSGDGNDKEWYLSTTGAVGAGAAALLDANSTIGTGDPSAWTNYIYSNYGGSSTESASLTFGPTTQSFSTITKIQPRIWQATYFGWRMIQITVDDNVSNDKAFVFMADPHIDVGLPRDFDKYITTTFIPRQVAWSHAIRTETIYTKDPVTGNDWDPATAFTYDWNIKTNTVETPYRFDAFDAPNALTSIPTGWVFYHKSKVTGGSVAGTGLSGTFSGRTYLDASGHYYANVNGTVTGTWGGNLEGDNLNISDSGLSGSAFYSGTVRGATPGSLSLTGTVTPTGAMYLTFTDDTLDDRIYGDFNLDAPLTCNCTTSGYGYTAAGTASGTGTGVAGDDVREYIHDQNKWDADWWSTNVFSGDAYGQGGYPYYLYRHSSAADVPLNVDFADLSTQVNYKSIFGSKLGVMLHWKQGTEQAKIGLDESMPDVHTFPADKYYYGPSPFIFSKVVDLDSTDVNNDTFVLDEVTGDTIAGTSNVYRIYGITKKTMFTPYPEARVYNIELDITGTAGPQPRICDFNITVTGATSTAKRKSKLLVSQKNFYRLDGTTLTDIVGAATAPTCGYTARWDTTKFFGKQYFTNGTDGIYRYPTAGNLIEDLGGTAPKCFTMASFISRLFTGRTVESGVLFQDRVRWCAIEDDSDWTGTGAGYIDLDDTDDGIVKLLPLGGTLVAYKETSLYNLHATGDRDDPVIKQLVSPGIGAAAMDTVLSIVGRDGLPAHIFLGQGRGGYNVYMYTGNILLPIGDDIKEELRDNLDPKQAGNAFAIVDQKRNQYMFFVCYSGQTFPSRAWLYDIDTGQWKHWNMPPVTCVGTLETNEVDDDVDAWTIYTGKVDSLSTWMDPDTNTDANGVDIYMKAESGDWAVEKRESYATLYRLHIHYYDKGYTPIAVKTSTDGGDTWSDPSTVYLGQSDGSADNSLRIAHVDLMATGKRFRVRIAHMADAAIKISEIIMELEEQGWIV